MSNQLRVLVLEDRSADAELLVHELRNAGYEPIWRRVETESDFLAHLDPSLDVILADYTLPQFDAVRALQLVQARGLDVPFIVVTATVGEESVIECMRQGAVDYLLKDRLARLGQAVRRALSERELRDEKRQAEAALRASERRFRALVENSTEGILLMEPDGSLPYASPSGQHVLGFSDDELVGRSALDLVHPEDRGTVLRRLRDLAMPRGKMIAVEFRAMHRDGSWRWIEAITNNLLDDPAVGAIVVNYRDISERKQAEEELRKTNEMLRALIQASPVAIVTLDQDGNVCGWNRAAERIFGWTEGEVLGYPEPIIVPGTEQRVQAARARVLRGDVLLGVEGRRLRRDGAAIDVNISAAPLYDATGAIRGLTGVFEDISERKRAEAALRFLAEASRLLSSSLELETTLENVARLAIPFLADWCAVDLVEADGSVRRVAAVHADPAKEARLHDLQRRFPAQRDATTPTMQALRTGEPILVPEVTDESLSSTARSPEYLAELRELGVESYMCVPLVWSDRSLGAITFVSGQPNRRYSLHDLTVADAIARRAALAIENARLYQAAREAEREVRVYAQFQATVAELGRRALAGTDLSDLLDEATRMVAQTLDVEFCNVLELLPDGEAFVLRAGVGWRDGLVGRVQCGAGVGALPGYTLLSTDPVVVEDLPAEKRFDSPALFRDHSVVSGVSVAIQGRDRPFGVLGAHTHRQCRFTKDAVHFLEAVANVLATSIERWQADEERARLLDEVSKLEAQRELSRMTSEFVSIVSHEFRTPLASLLGFSELLLSREAPDPVRQRWISVMHTEAKRLTSLVEEILDLSRIEQGRVELDLQPVDIRRAVGEVLESLAAQLGGHQFEQNYQESLPLVLADPGKLAQVLMNLVSNAIKYSPNGGTIRIAAEADYMMHMSISDEGLGLPAEEIPKLFQRFHRIDGSERRRIRGTGLGLYITRHLVKLHSGQIWAESPGPERGSTFHLELPIAR